MRLHTNKKSYLWCQLSRTWTCDDMCPHDLETVRCDLRRRLVLGHFLLISLFITLSLLLVLVGGGRLLNLVPLSSHNLSKLGDLGVWVLSLGLGSHIIHEEEVSRLWSLQRKCLNHHHKSTALERKITRGWARVLAQETHQRKEKVNNGATTTARSPKPHPNCTLQEPQVHIYILNLPLEH